MRAQHRSTGWLFLGTLIGGIVCVVAAFTWLLLGPMWRDYRLVRALEDVKNTPDLEITARKLTISNPNFDQHVFDRSEFQGDRGAVMLAKFIQDERHDELLRHLAARLLAKNPTSAIPAVPGLTLALQGSDEHSRWCAAFALNRIGPAARDAIPALIGALKCSDWQTRFLAATALGNIGPDAKPAASAIKELLDDDTFRSAVMDETVMLIGGANPDENYRLCRIQIQIALHNIGALSVPQDTD
jgi:hypothetical protein